MWGVRIKFITNLKNIEYISKKFSIEDKSTWRFLLSSLTLSIPGGGFCDMKNEEIWITFKIMASSCLNLMDKDILKSEFKFIRKFISDIIITSKFGAPKYVWTSVSKSLWRHSEASFCSKLLNICTLSLLTNFYDSAKFGSVCLKGNQVARGEMDSYVLLKVLAYWWPFWKMTSFLPLKWSDFWYHGIFQVITTREACDAKLVILSSQSPSCHFIALTD